VKVASWRDKDQFKAGTKAGKKKRALRP